MGNKNEMSRDTSLKNEYARRKKPNKLKNMSAWVEQCDNRLSCDLFDIAERICEDKDVKLIRLVGPTCSGKTTAAKMLMKRFSSLGKHMHTISIDDFYYDTAILRQMSKEKGMTDIDYDSPDTIDMGELKRFVGEIFSNDRFGIAIATS